MSTAGLEINLECAGSFLGLEGPELPDEQQKINESLATGIARAYRWQELLDSGEFDSPEALAEALNVNVSYVRRFLRLPLLAPPIVDAIFAGRAPWSLSLTKLDTNLPFSWKEQMKLFGMAGGCRPASADRSRGAAGRQDRGDTPSSLEYQFALLRKTGFREVALLHKNLVFGAYYARK